LANFFLANFFFGQLIFGQLFLANFFAYLIMGTLWNERHLRFGIFVVGFISIETLLSYAFTIRIARFFSVQHTKTGKIYQITRKHTKWPQNIPDGRKIDQMALQ
jgi:hypothetical protein